MASDSALPPVIGAIADDRNGNPLGTITAVFLDDLTEQPTWVGLTPGLHASPDTDDVVVIAPITGADFTDGRLRLAVTGEAVQSAPRPSSPDRLSPAEETTLREHYRRGTAESTTTGTTAGTTTGTTTYGTAAGTYGDSSVGTGTGAPLPPPPYGTVPPAGSVVPPTTPAGSDDPARGTGEVR